jgi:hypothetical protein
VGHALGAEDAHQVVFERQEELRRAGIALAAGAAAELVVDAAAFVPLGAEDMEPSGGDHFLLVLFAIGLNLVENFAVSALRP